MYFLIFQPKDVLKLCLSFNETQPIYAYKHYTYEKKVCVIYCILGIIHLVRTKNFSETCARTKWVIPYIKKQNSPVPNYDNHTPRDANSRKTYHVIRSFELYSMSYLNGLERIQLR